MLTAHTITKDLQYYKFCAYGFLKNLRLFEPFFFIILLEKGLSYTLIGTLFATKEIVSNILEIPTGILSDALGRKSSMLFSFFSYSLCFWLFSSADSIIAIFFAMFLFSFGDVFRTGTHKAIIFDYLARTEQVKYAKEYYGRTRSASKIGSAISAIIAAILVIYTQNYSLIFQVSAGFSVIGFFLILSYPKALNHKVIHKNARNKYADLFNHVKSLFVDLSPKNLRQIGNIALPSGMNKGLQDYIQPILTTLLAPLMLFSAWNSDQNLALLLALVYSLFFIASAIASRLSAKSSARFTQDTTFLNLTLFLTPVIFIFISFAYGFHYSIFIILGYLIVNINENLRKPVAVAVLGKQTDPRLFASILSVEAQVESIFAAIVVFLAGWLSDIFNSLGMGIAVTALLMLTIALFLKIPKKS